MNKVLLLAVSIVVPAALVIMACGKNEQTGVRLKVLLGATTIVAPGDAPILDSIVVIAGSKIRAAGMRKDIPVPQNSDRTDLTGRWLVPVPGGRIKPDEPANLLILKTAPAGTTAADPADITSRILNGEWKF